MGFKKFDGSTWQSITPKQLKGIPYTGTLPATLTGTKVGYLHRYKIYGNVGENLFDENAIDPDNGYDDTGRYLTANGATGGSTGGTWRISEYIKIKPNASYILNGITTGINPSYCFYDAYKTYISGERYASQTVLSISTPNNAEYIRFSRNINTDDVTMLVEGSTAPSTYMPYEECGEITENGYKLPLTSGNTPVDIYIGNDTLSIEEYVDSGTGKIYRMVSGVLTPVDPPVPFPQIPTSANSTTISWNGEELAPSQFDSIQEWVDIPTYTRVNGEWVADN